MKRNKENSFIMKLKHIINYDKYRKEMLELKNKGEITEKEFKKRTLKVWIDSMIIVLAIISIPAIIIGSYAIVENINEKKQLAAEEARLAAQIEVPNVMGMTLDEATETLKNIGLEVIVSDYEKKQIEQKTNEYVVSKQSPRAKEKVDKNTEITLYFKELKTIESDNTYGMRFKKNISEFCEDYNKAIENININLGKNDTQLSAVKRIACIEEKDFSYIRNIRRQFKGISTFKSWILYFYIFRTRF